MRAAPTKLSRPATSSSRSDDPVTRMFYFRKSDFRANTRSLACTAAAAALLSTAGTASAEGTFTVTPGPEGQVCAEGTNPFRIDLADGVVKGMIGDGYQDIGQVRRPTVRIRRGAGAVEVEAPRFGEEYVAGEVALAVSGSLLTCMAPTTIDIVGGTLAVRAETPSHRVDTEIEVTELSAKEMKLQVLVRYSSTFNGQTTSLLQPNDPRLFVRFRDLPLEFESLTGEDDLEVGVSALWNSVAFVNQQS